MADNLPVPSGSDGQLVVTVDSRQAISGLSAIEAQFIRMTNTVNSSMAGATSAINRFMNMIKMAGMAIASFASVKAILNGVKAAFESLINVARNFASRMIEVNRIYSGFIASMTVIKGSVQAAGKEYKFLLDMSNKLGVEVETSITQYHRLAAALKNVDTTGELTRHIFSGLSQAAVVLHSRGHDVTLIFEAVQQMASKSKLSLEELQRQLGNTLPGAVSLAARAMMQSQKYIKAGITSTAQAERKLRDQIQKGTINVYEFLLLLSNQLKTEYGAGVEYAQTQFVANFNRMKNAAMEFFREVGSSSAMDGLTKLVQKVTELFNQGSAEGAFGLGTAIGDMFQKIAIWVDQLDSQNINDFFQAVILYVSSAQIVLESFFDVFTKFGDPSLETPLTSFVGFVAKTFAIFTDILNVAVGGVMMVVSTFKWVFQAIQQVGDAITGAAFSVGEKVWSVMPDSDRKTQAMANFRDFRARAAQRDKEYDANIAYGKAGAAAFFDGPGEGNTAYDRVSKQLEASRTAVAASRFGVKPWSLGEAPWKAQQNVGNGSMLITRPVASDASSGYMNPLNALDLNAIMERVLANSGAPNSGSPKRKDREAERALAKAVREYEKLENAVSRWRGEAGVTEKAEEKLRRAEEQLTEAVGKRDPVTGKLLMTETEYQEIMEKLRQRYEEALDPIGFVLRAYDKETTALKYVGDAANEYSEILKQQEKWREGNIKYTEKDIDQLREKIRLQSEANRMQRAMEQVLSNTVYAQRDKKDKLSAIEQLTNGYTDPSGKKTQISKGQSAQQVIDFFGKDKMKGSEEYYAAQKQAYDDYIAYIEQARDAHLLSERTANALMSQAWAEQWASRVAPAESALGAISTLMMSTNKDAFRVGQAAAIAQVIIQQSVAAMNAWSSAQVYPPPTGQILGGIGVAMAVAQGAMQISRIRSQQPPSFRTGGEYIVGGTGGIDSQLVQFHATPGEKVTINTPSQAKALEDMRKEMQQGNQPRVQNLNLTVVQQGRPDNRTPEQNAREMRKQAYKMEVF